MSAQTLLPAALEALRRVARARELGVLHTESWARELNAYAPEMSVELAREVIPGLRVLSMAPAESDRKPLFVLLSPNPYARSLAEFAAAARYLAEALQRPVHLFDPQISKDIPIKNWIWSVTHHRAAALLVEGPTAAVNAAACVPGIGPGAIECLVSIHADVPAEIDAVYRVGHENGQGTTWAGVPETPLVLSRWIPELGTYLDAIRPWLDLHLS